MSMECFKDMPCTLKLAYVLIAILFLLNVFSLTKTGMGTTVASSVKDSKIAKWVNENPEVILDSVNRYAQKQQEEAYRKQQEQSVENIKNFENELKDTKHAGVLNPKGTIDMIVFYDYNCGYCKIASRNVDELLKTRGDVRVILRDIPILGEPSRYASQVGMAVLISQPKKYPEYHRALMNGTARSKEDVKKAVEKIGLKMDKIESVMSKNKNEIDEAISNNLDLAGKIGINGTPAFVINGELIPGAVDAQTLNERIGK